MAAKTQVHEEVAEVSTNSKASLEIQGEQCALDVSSYQDLPKLPVPDCNGNGISHHDDNGIARDDAEDNSYVFVSGNDDPIPIDNDLKGSAQVSDDSEGVEVQNREFLNSSASGVDSCWVFEGTEVTSSNNCSVDKSDADALQVAVIDDAARQNGRVGSVDSVSEQPEDHQIDPNSSLAAEKNQESEIGVLETALDITESIDINHKSEENNFESTCEVREDQESQHASLEATPCKSAEVGILESRADSVGNLEPDISLDVVESIDVNQESQENNFESTSELGEGQESQHANFACKFSQVLASGADSVGNPEPEIALDVVETIDVNKKYGKENLESTSESGEGQESQNTGLEFTSSGSSEVEVSKGNEAQQISESSDELGGTQDSQNMRSDSAGHKSLQTKVQKVNTEEQSDPESTSIIPVTIPEQSESYHDDDLDNDGQKLEDQTKTQLPSDAKANQETVPVLTENGITPEQSESYHGDNHDNDAQKLEEQTKTQLPLDAKENQETVSVLAENGRIPVTIPEQSESYHADNLDNDGQKLEEQTKTHLLSDAKANQETVTVLAENGITPVTIPEQSESYHDDNPDNDGQKLEEQTKTQLPSDAKANQETVTVLAENGITPVTIPEQSESYHGDNFDNDAQKLEEQTKTQLSSDAKENQETVTVLAENGTIPVTIPEQAESYHDDNLDNDGQKLEEQTKTQLPSDAKENQETVTVLAENGTTPVTIPEQAESYHDDNLVNDGQKLEEQTKAQLPSDAKENQETVTVLAENGTIPVTIPEQAESYHDDNLDNDGQKLEEQPKTQLPSDAKENQETVTVLAENGTIPVTIPEQSESYHGDNLDNDGQKLEEQTKTQVPSDAKENHETVTVLAENGECVVDPGNKIEKSVNEVELPSGTETACSPVLNENKFLVSSVNDSVPEAKESIEHMDDSEKSHELQQSSKNTDSLTPAADSDIGQRPVESDENVLDIARDHEAEYKTSPSIESVAANTHEIIKPETGDADNVAVESVEHAPNLTREHGTEHVSSCLTENDAATAKEVIQRETEVENLEGAVSSPVSDSKFKTITVQGVNDTSVAGGDSTNCSTNKVITRMEFELETPDPEEVATLQPDHVHLKTEVSVVDAECAGLQSLPSGAEKEFEVGSSSVVSSSDMPCNDVSSVNHVSDSLVTKDKLRNCVPENVDIESKVEHLSGTRLNSDDKLTCEETKDVENSLNNGKSMSLPENSCAGAVAGQDVVVEPLTRPFHFLIRMPRFEDFKMKEQIRKAQVLVEEKTQHRDAFRIEVQKYKANCLGYAAEYEAAVSESRALKRSVKAKRAEIDSLQSVINKVKNAISVEDIDTRIHSMEHMIEHETLPLKEEKLLIREIKQLKQLREQLSSNIGSQDEVQQALNDRDQIEERLKVLKKELDSVKDSVLKADAVARALEKKYEDENKKVKEVQTQYSAANNVRQDAYAHLQSLRKQLFEKNQQFRMYKDNAAAASDYAAKRDREALHHLCINQVESIMELWNKNNEFRKDYVRCNMKSTLRRLGTLDGRSLGPDEQPPVLTSYGDERVDQLVSNPVNSGPILQTPILVQEVVKPVQGVTVSDKTKVKESNQKSLTTRPRKEEKPVLGDGFATVSGREITDEIREERHMPTEEELDLARKVEELRKEEAAAKLKEQRRLEEREKALEALERKKRNAEKAQMRAELRAQKEAGQREKEREKRLRKKERKKGTATEVPDGNNLVETTPNRESSTETIKEPEIKDNPPAVSKRPQKPSQFTKQSKAKSIPPPLRNRSRRKIQQWMWVILTCLLVIALFLLGNVGFFSNLSNLGRRNSGF